MSERPTQAEIDEANSTHAQEAQMLGWEEALRISETKEVNEAICNFQEDATEDNCLGMIRAIVSKLREKDAANVKHWWKLCGETTGQLADTQMLLAKAELTIAQQKNKLEFTEAIIAGDDAMITGLEEELFTSQEQVKMLREAMQDLKDEGVLKHSIIDKALAATAPKGE